MKKLIIAFSFWLLAFSVSAQTGIQQKFAPFSLTMDSLSTHAGYQNQYIVVYGAHAVNDGYGGIFICDSTSTAADIPYKVITVTGTNKKWIAVQISGAGSGDTSIYNNPDFVVINILTVPPGSPATGDKYLAGVGSAGAWIGQDNDVENWSGSAWTQTVPTKGQLLINGANDDVLQFNGSTWNVITATFLYHNKGDNYGNIPLYLGNKKNKPQWFLQNNINRGGFAVGGYFNLYSVRDYVSGDSVLTIHNGEVRRAPSSAFAGGAGGLTYDQTVAATSDGQTSFTFSGASAPAIYQVFRNGVKRKTGFSLSGTTLTTTDTDIVTGDVIEISY